VLLLQETQARLTSKVSKQLATTEAELLPLNCELHAVATA